MKITQDATKERGRPANDGKIRVLAVDDNHDAMKFLTRALDAMGYAYVTATNGKMAMEILHEQGESIDVVLLDRIMPFMDGMNVVRNMRQDPVLRRIPIVMQTGCKDAEDISEGMAAGVFYYLIKPYDLTVLRGIMDAAVRESQQNKSLHSKLVRHQAGFDMLQTGKFRFQTPQDAESLACFLANCFPEPAHVITGLAELLLNAVEHGNLNIGFEKKKELLQSGTLHAEIQKRLLHPEYSNRWAEAAITRRDGGVYVVISDEGQGFDWKKYLKIDPARADSPLGRGIAHASTICFDKLSFNEKGNKAIAFVGDDSLPLDW